MRKRCIYCQQVSDVAESMDDCPACGMTNKLTPFIATPAVHGAVAFEAFASPCDGRPIRTMAEYKEDLRRNNCVPYEPGIKQDQDRRAKREERETSQLVDKIVHETVQRTTV